MKTQSLSTRGSTPYIHLPPQFLRKQTNKNNEKFLKKKKHSQQNSKSKKNSQNLKFYAMGKCKR